MGVALLASTQFGLFVGSFISISNHLFVVIGRNEFFAIVSVDLGDAIEEKAYAFLLCLVVQVLEKRVIPVSWLVLVVHWHTTCFPQELLVICCFFEAAFDIPFSSTLQQVEGIC